MKIENRIASIDITILEALKLMDDTSFRSLIVLDKNSTFKGILSIGDIQRSLIRNNKLDICISEILRPNPKIAKKEDSFEQIKADMIKYRMEFIPVIDSENKIENIYYWEDIFETKTLPLNQFNLPIVVMAGGTGSRLKPLTNVLPKPLIPIGEKTIIEDIFDRFYNHGCNTFHISVNYKADFIENYLTDLKLPYNLNFFREDKPLGTAGSLSLLKGKIKETFFVSNCDILIEQDYSEILEYHKSNKNEITIVAVLKHFSIAYGTMETGENGQLISLIEKPDLTFKINSGMYILEPQLLKEIPSDTFFHITHLIDKVLNRKGSVGVFPVSEKSWKDVGNWEEYLNQMKY